MSVLHNALNDQAAKLRGRKKEILEQYGDKTVAGVTPGHVFGGMRGVPALICETSTVSADEGLRVRDIPIMELTDKTPEETFWLLLTGQLPNAEELSALQDVFAKYYEIPSYVVDTLKAMPKDSHPMAMLSAGLLAMERESEFRKAYNEGMGKDELWKPLVNDGVRLIASMPGLAAAIYRIRFDKGDIIKPLADDKDMSNNFAHMLGVSDDPGLERAPSPVSGTPQRPRGWQRFGIHRLRRQLRAERPVLRRLCSSLRPRRPAAWPCQPGMPEVHHGRP